MENDWLSNHQIAMENDINFCYEKAEINFCYEKAELTELQRSLAHRWLPNHQIAMENDINFCYEKAERTELERSLNDFLTELKRSLEHRWLPNHQIAMENDINFCYEKAEWLSNHQIAMENDKPYSQQKEAGRTELERSLNDFWLSNHRIAMENDLTELQRSLKHRKPYSQQKEAGLTELQRSLKHRQTELERSLNDFWLSNHQIAMENDLVSNHQREMKNDAIHDVAARDEKMIVGSQEVHSNYRRSCHGTKLMKSALILALIFWPYAGGTGHGSGQPEHKGHSEIYQSTLHIVSSCPSPKEYIQKSIAKCVDVCGSYMQDGNCAYHCMRDSSKTKLVEFCAQPEILFDYCPEYDPVDQTIQKDTATLCNSKFSRNYYNSSDIYFCDPDNCLQLHESSVRSGATTLTTLMNETTEMDGGDIQEWYTPLLIGAAALIVAILLECILWVFYKRGSFPGYPSYTVQLMT